MIDWHCHILPGIDDGPATMEESVEMGRALRKAGFTTVYCTPHLIRGSFDADNGAVIKAVAALQARLEAEDIPLQLLPGREYYLDEFLLDYLKDPLPLGDTKYLLIEIPNHMSLAYVKETCYRIRCSGFTPMIAHPERCHLLVPKTQHTDRKGLWGLLFNSKLETRNSKPADNSLLAYLQEIVCQFQGNLGSFAGMYGGRVKRSAEKLRELGIYSHFGSDLHAAASVGQIVAGADAAVISGVRPAKPGFSAVKAS